MKGFSKKKLFVFIGALSLLLIAVFVFVFVLNRNTKEQSLQTLTGSQFADGVCNDELRDQLITKESGEGLELLGLCYVYRNENDRAAEAYKKSSETYAQEGNADKSTLLKNAQQSLIVPEQSADLEKLLQQNRNPELEGGL